MQATDDLALLREYTANNSERAFSELVSRHVNFVYSCALRQVRVPHIAEEVTQAVFVILAQKSAKIGAQTNVTGWLFKTTHFVALAQARAAAKHSQRMATIQKEVQMQTEISTPADDEMWNKVSPLLDQAIAGLGEKDRHAVLLRFFENKSIAEIGVALGTGEDTARKRVSRALDKLRKHFSKRGICWTSAVLTAVLTANSIHAAPAGMAKTISSLAVAKGTACSASTLTLIKAALKLMKWSKAKAAFITSVGVFFVVGISAETAMHIKNKPAESPAQSVVAQAAQDSTPGEPANIPLPAPESPAKSEVNNVNLTAFDILEKANEAYASLSTYRDTGWTVHSYKGDSWTNTFTELLGTRTCYRVEIVTAAHPYSRTEKYWSDGLDSHVQLDRSIASSHAGEPSANLPPVSNETAIPAIYFNLRWANVFVPLRLGPTNELVRRTDEVIGGTDCFVIERITPKFEGTLWVGKNDFLIRRCKHLGNIETHENISTNEIFTRADYIPAELRANALK